MNDEALRRKYRIALSAIWVLVCVAIGASIWGASWQRNSWSWYDQLNATQAEYDTGQCGSKRMVVIDDRRVAIAGRLVAPKDIDIFSFEEGADRKTLSAYVTNEVRLFDGRVEKKRELLWTRELK